MIDLQIRTLPNRRLTTVTTVTHSFVVPLVDRKRLTIGGLNRAFV